MTVDPELNGTFLLAPSDAGPIPTGGTEPSSHYLHRKQQLIVDIRHHASRLGERAENLEMILEAGTLLPFHFLRQGDRLGRAVVKLRRQDGPVGTGFLVAPDILLTNHHVLPDVAIASGCVALANFEAVPPGDPIGRPATATLDPATLFVTNSELDFTFCGVRGLEYLGVVPLDRNSLNIVSPETVNIIQHPRGRAKEVALRDNRVVKVDNVVVHYVCATEPGSSGSPVFNNQWNPVAIHHASILADGRDRPSGTTGDHPPRYLNEGIRLSAIAIWLETLEADTPSQNAQVTRLRSIFGGLDPQVGFFGALGRRSLGRSAPETVMETYRSDGDDLDVAYWDASGMGTVFRDRLPELARLVAQMRMDIWIIANLETTVADGLRDALRETFQLDYELSAGGDAEAGTLAILHRRTEAIRREELTEASDSAGKRPGPAAFRIEVESSRGERSTVRLAAIPCGTREGWLSTLDRIRSAIRREGDPAVDWLLIGPSRVMLTPERMRLLADCGREIAAATDDRDGGIVLLSGRESRIHRMFASPNLHPAFGVPDVLSVVRDRELPPAAHSFGGPAPIAIRLAFGGTARSRPREPLPDRSEVDRVAPPSLEDHVRGLLLPILRKLIGESGLGVLPSLEDGPRSSAPLPP